MKRKSLWRRPSWDEIFMFQAISSATRHSCLKRSVGSVMVKGNKIIASGYNGAAKGIKSCLELGYCYYERLAEQESRENNGDPKTVKELFKMYCQAVHAEVNTRSQCDSEEIKGATIYITNIPCPKCTQDIIITSGIKTVVAWKDYLQNNALTIDERRASEKKLLEAGISLNFLRLTPKRIMEIAEYMAHKVGERTDYQFK